MNQDFEHLKILAIFHYVVAGLSALFGSFPILHLMAGITFLTSGVFSAAASSGEMPYGFFTLFGLMFTLIPAVIILSGWALAVGLAIAGWSLGKRQHYTFCLVMAGIVCVFMPFGTVLGAFTIIVLVRPSVRALFGVNEQAMPERLPE
ncbi:MAG: hypothetical protein HYZ26_12790 [Chloroflexi bacterium]|nr:hypothetical protein [Chloroflexota bacterium]